MKQPTMPSVTLLKGAPYVNAANTNLKARFDAIRAELAKATQPANVQQLQRRRK